MINSIGLPTVFRICFLLCAVTALTVGVRLLILRLLSIYPAFVAYLFLIAGVNLTAYAFHTGSALYAWVYLFGYPIILITSALMVREAYSQIFTNYPGIATLGRWGIYLAVAAAFIFAAVDWAGTRPLFNQLRSYLPLVEMLIRGVNIGLAALLVVLLGILYRYPIRPHQNVVTNCMMLSAILLADAMHGLVDRLTSLRSSFTVSVIDSLFTATCFVVWTFLLSRQGEKRTVQVRTHFRPGDEVRLLHQLDAFNEILSRTVHK